MSPLEGQVAVLTGGSGGVGAGIAAALDRRGARVVVSGRDRGRVEATAARLAHGAGFAGCDVRDPERIEALFRFAEERFGPVDIAIACAGIGRAASPRRSFPDPVATLEAREWEEAIDTNLRGVFHLARAAARRMTARHTGQIVNISSARGALRGSAFGAGYCASKRAARAMFHALAAELAPQGVRAFSILPDAVDTGLIAGTRLAGPRGAMTPDDLGDLVADLLAMPLDAVLEDVLVAPRGARRAADEPGRREEAP